MKKSTGILFGFGIFLVIGCALLALVMYPSAKDSVTTPVNESYKPKSSTLNLKVNSLSDITISKTSSDKVKISGTTVKLNNETIVTSQDGDTITVETVKGKKNKNDEFVTSTFNNIAGSNGHGELTIAIPTSVTDLAITTNNADIYSLSVDTLSVTQTRTSGNNSIYINGLKASSVNFAGNLNHLELTGSTVDKITSDKLKGGDFLLDSNTFATAEFSGDSVNFSANNNLGNLAFAETTSGNVSLSSHTGDVKIDAVSTDVSLDDKFIGNLDVTLSRSNISGSFYEDPADTFIKATVTTGETNLFGKKTFGKTTAKYQWNLKTTLGNIHLSNYNDYDDSDDDDLNEVDDDDDVDESSDIQESTASSADMSSIPASTATSTSLSKETDVDATKTSGASIPEDNQIKNQ